MGSVAGIVLAGGSSTRFGSDKLRAPYRGRPLLHHAIAAVAAVSGDVVVVMGPAAGRPARARLDRGRGAAGGPARGPVGGRSLRRRRGGGRRHAGGPGGRA